MIINDYDKIVNKFNTLKEINLETERIYSNITYQTTKLAFEYNEVIEEKDRIILEDIQNKYSKHLEIYDDIATNILNITLEYEEIIIERDLLYERARIEDGIIDIREVIIDPIIYKDLEDRILNIVEVYNESIEQYIIVSVKIQELSIIYNSVITRTQPDLYNDGPIISIEKYNYLENKIRNIVTTYNNALDLYNTDLINNIVLMNNKTKEIEDSIFNFNIVLETESNLYSIRLFSILLNVFVKNFRIMTYTQRTNNIKVLKKEYLIYLQNLKKFNTAFIISHLHQIYITPLLLLSNTTETIILKDNIIDLRKISSYYGTISPDFIQFNVKLLTDNIRSNLLDNTIDIFTKTYNGTLYFNPDYRNKTYEIEIEAYSMLISRQKYKFILIENGFPAINPIYFEESNIKLGKINNNTFDLNLNNYYNDSNILFMIESSYSILSNLTYDDIYHYETQYIDYCNIPIITDTIVITPYLKGYPILFEEYSNTAVILNIISSPSITSNYFAFELTDRIFYEYDLTQINEWYINVVEESIITFEFIVNTRDNLKYISKPIIELNSNILKINPDYRDGTYKIKVDIESPNDYSFKNILELDITEGPVPKPVRNIRNLLLEHLLLEETTIFNANNYFISKTGELLQFDYNVSNIIDYTNNETKVDQLPYDTFNITESNLIFTPDYRNIEYELYVYAIDSIYNVRSEEYLIINVREEKILNVLNEDEVNKIILNIEDKDIIFYELDEYELGNDKLNININNYIKFPINQRSRYINGLRYYVSTDKDLRKNKVNQRNAININEDGILEIEPDYRNISYTINILVESYEFSYRDNINFSFSIIEVPALFPIIKNINIEITNTIYNKEIKTLYINDLSIYEKTINLNLFFDNNIEYSKNKYQIVSGNTEYYKIINNNLKIIPNVRDTTYNFSIIAIDNIYETYNDNDSNLLNIEVNELRSISLNNNNIVYNLSNNEVFIDLNDIFNSTIYNTILNYNIEFEENYNIRRNVSTFSNPYSIKNNILYLYPDYRGLSYRLNVIGFNRNYLDQYLVYNIDINESERLPLEKKINSIQINLERLKYTTDDIRINLEDLFVHFRYYPNYSLRIQSEVLIADLIYISLGYLVISNTDYDTNFTINIELFDINNIKDSNNIIRINFITNVISITFNNLITEQTIYLDELTENTRYEVLGLNGIDISSTVELINNNIIINKSLSSYDFVLNKINIDLNLIIKQVFYKINTNL